MNGGQEGCRRRTCHTYDYDYYCNLPIESSIVPCVRECGTHVHVYVPALCMCTRTVYVHMHVPVQCDENISTCLCVLKQILRHLPNFTTTMTRQFLAEEEPGRREMEGGQDGCRRRTCHTYDYDSNCNLPIESSVAPWVHMCAHVYVPALCMCTRTCVRMCTYLCNVTKTSALVCLFVRFETNPPSPTQHTWAIS
jgi:hypothetical protein